MTPSHKPPLAEDPDAKTNPFMFRLELLQNDAGNIGCRRGRCRQRIQAQLQQRRGRCSVQLRGAGLNLHRAAVGLKHPQHGRRAGSFAVRTRGQQHAQSALIERMDQVGDRQADHLVPPPAELQQGQEGPIGVPHQASRDQCRRSRYGLAQTGRNGGRIGRVRRPQRSSCLTEIRRLKDNGAEHQRSNAERRCRRAAGPCSDHRAIEQHQGPC